MMSSDFFFRNKIPVAVLGVAGKIGQELVQRLVSHPWFEIIALSDENDPIFPCSIIFSCLHSSESYPKEKLLAQAGYFVISSSVYKVQDHIPLIVAEINSDQLACLQKQENQGGIIAYPDSIASGLALTLKPLIDEFGLDCVQATILQDFNQTDSKKKKDFFSDQKRNSEIEQQSLLILGDLEKRSFKLGFHGVYQQEQDNKIISISLKLKKPTQVKDLIQAWNTFKSKSQRLPLPTAAFQPVYYLTDSQNVPCDKKIIVYIEQLCQSSSFDYTFKLLLSDTKRNTIEFMLLNAELLVTQGYIYW